jgi:integrase
MRLKSTLLSKETFCQKKVKDFLESVGRNSVKSERIYGFALSHFQTFLNDKFDDTTTTTTTTLETIIDSIVRKEINVYTLLDNFVSYLISPNARQTKLSPNSISLYVAAVRSFLQYYDIDIAPSKFKRRVKLPKNHREDEEPLDVADIRRLLLSCNNRRLKPYLLVLASGGMRAVEALAIRIKDLDFSVSPTKVHIRKEYSKTRVARDVYISNEGTRFLKELIDFRYRDRKKHPTPKISPEDLVFSRTYFRDYVDPRGLYSKISQEFHYLLKTVEMDELKEGMNRRKITLHSFRRFVKSVISTQVGQDYSEWFLGHRKSPYWTLKETERREIYSTKIMSYLTFLDYRTLEVTGKNVEARLEEKEKEINYLRERDLKHETEMKEMRQQMDKIISVIQENPKLAKVKTEVLSEI